jgi:DNA/RNA-binding domain of Phe-tRNA-synthetase-like protein
VSVQLALASELRAIVAPVVLTFEAVSAMARDARMDAPIEATAAHLRQATDLEPAIAAVRTMYRRLGIDPTKTRPSSEALLRRLRKGDELPRINSLVDICNWCSVEVQLPFGLYDRARIEGDVITLRRGLEGEGYEGIRKDRVNVGGRMTLADAAGPFGNPTSDSARTMVTLATAGVVFVIYAPADLSPDVAARAATLTETRVAAYARTAARVGTS